MHISRSLESFLLFIIILYTIHLQYSPNDHAPSSSSSPPLFQLKHHSNGIPIINNYNKYFTSVFSSLRRGRFKTNFFLVEGLVMNTETLKLPFRFNINWFFRESDIVNRTTQSGRCIPFVGIFYINMDLGNKTNAKCKHHSCPEPIGMQDWWQTNHSY